MILHPFTYIWYSSLTAADTWLAESDATIKTQPVSQAEFAAQVETIQQYMKNVLKVNWTERGREAVLVVGGLNPDASVLRAPKADLKATSDAEAKAQRDAELALLRKPKATPTVLSANPSADPSAVPITKPSATDPAVPSTDASITTSAIADPCSPTLQDRRSVASIITAISTPRASVSATFTPARTPSVTTNNIACRPEFAKVASTLEKLLQTSPTAVAKRRGKSSIFSFAPASGKLLVCLCFLPSQIVAHYLSHFFFLLLFSGEGERSAGCTIEADGGSRHWRNIQVSRGAGKRIQHRKCIIFCCFQASFFAIFLPVVLTLLNLFLPTTHTHTGFVGCPICCRQYYR